MKLVIQRVNHASVTVDGTITGQIDRGLLVFIGIEGNDSLMMLPRYVDKLIKLRIFSDENDKINLSLSDVGGGLLIVSQFTLYADCKKGHRPSFTRAASPERANALYEEFIRLCRLQCNNVQTGIFGAKMTVDIENDGPFTIIFDSSEM